MNELVVAMKIAGFEFKYPLQIVIENSLDTIAIRTSGTDKIQSTWVDHNGGAFVHAARWVGLKFNSKKVVPLEPWISKKQQGLAVVFTKANEIFHFLQNPFTIVHELTHTTENPDSHNSRYWSEARSDFVAFAITGIGELILPGGIKIEILNSENQVVIERREVLRSLKNPTVANTRDVIPRYNQYHLNSQPISAALFEMSQKVGLEKALAIIHFIDRRKFPAIPDRTEFDDIDIGHFIGLSVARTIQHDLKKTGEVLEIAIRAMNFTPATQNQLLKILENRGLLVPN